MADIQIDGGEGFACAEDDTLLRAAQRAGLGFPYSCNVGSCGNCRFQLLEGEVEHIHPDPPAYSERDVKRGRWLGCQARPLQDCRIKLRLDPEAAPAHPPVRMTGELTEVIELTHDISEFAFSVDGADAFLPGQYALIEPPGVQGGRAYSMCNLPGEGELRFQIKRVPGGAATGALFDQMKTGDTAALDGPYGLAYLREDQPGDLLLIAGGSGLSPMVSIARAAAASPALSDRQIHFVYGCRQTRDICGEDQLKALEGFGDRLHYVAALSEPEEGWAGPRGFVHEAVRQAYGDRFADFTVYFAGPSPMAQALQTMLHEEGADMSRVHFDEFY